MKAEISNENKERFFALYWGLDVSKVKDPDITFTIPVSEEVIRTNGNYCLSLKPIHAISDEETVELGKLLKIESTSAGTLIWIKETLPKTIKGGEASIHSGITDYLRSRGYALPFMGLSVEEMISAGWIKLIEPTKEYNYDNRQAT